MICRNEYRATEKDGILRPFSHPFRKACFRFFSYEGRPSVFICEASSVPAFSARSRKRAFSTGFLIFPVRSGKEKPPQAILRRFFALPKITLLPTESRDVLSRPSIPQLSSVGFSRFLRRTAMRPPDAILRSERLQTVPDASRRRRLSRTRSPS